MSTMPPLIAAAQAGDGSALAEIWRLNQPTVYRYILRRVDGDRALAEDITQETFLRVYTKLHTFQWAGRAFDAWLVTIARNLVIDHYKRKSTHLEVPVDFLDELALYDTYAEPSAEELALMRLTAGPVRDALSRLLPQWREALILQYWCGMSDREIGNRTGRTPGAVKTLKGRARDELRKQLSPAV